MKTLKTSGVFAVSTITRANKHLNIDFINIHNEIYELMTLEKLAFIGRISIYKSLIGLLTVKG